MYSNGTESRFGLHAPTKKPRCGAKDLRVRRARSTTDTPGRLTLSFPILRELAAELAPLLAPLVAQELRGAPVADGWVSQKGSKLGRNRHIAEVRRLVAGGHTDRATIQGRSYLLRKDAYDQAIIASGRNPTSPVKVSQSAATAEDEDVAYFRSRLGSR